MQDAERTDVASYQFHLSHQSFFVLGEEHASGLRGSAWVLAAASHRAADG
jgi:hypothetical protein